jgi:integrase
VRASETTRPAITGGGIAQPLRDPLHDLDCGSITVDQIVAVLKPLHLTKPATAEKFRGFLSACFDATIARGLRTSSNPADKKTLGVVLPKRASQTKHLAALAYTEAPALFKALEREGTAGRVMRLLMLTGCRKMEIVNLRWSEWNEAEDMLILPASRTKMGRDFRVPLSEAAIAILRQQRAFGVTSEYAFPSPHRPTRPLSPSIMNDLLKRLSVTETVHGFRTTMSIYLQEVAKADVFLIEQCLAHQIGNAATRAYLRSDNLERRKDLLEMWGRYLTA